MIYIIGNSAQPTTAAPVKQPTGNTIRTMMQLRTAVGINAKVIAWGASFDAFALALPGQVELFETTVAATMSTAYAVGDIMPYKPWNAPANTAGAGGVPFNLSTGTSGFATAGVTEGTVAGYRLGDMQMISPTGQYNYQWPLAREFDLTPQMFLRVRVTFSATVNAYFYVVVEL